VVEYCHTKRKSVRKPLAGRGRSLSLLCTLKRVCLSHSVSDVRRTVKKAKESNGRNLFGFAPFLFERIFEMARTKSKDETCTVQVALKLTPTEAGRLRSLADRAGLNLSATLKALLAAAELERVEVWRPVVKGVQR